MNKKWLLFSGLGSLLIVPLYLACSSNPVPPAASQVQADAKAAALGTWQGSADIDGETVPFSLALQEATRRAKTPVIGVVGTLTSENPNLNGVVDGALTVDGDVEHIDLALRLEDGKTLSGAVEKSAIADGRINDKAPVGTFSMTRL